MNYIHVPMNNKTLASVPRLFDNLVELLLFYSEKMNLLPVKRSTGSIV